MVPYGTDLLLEPYGFATIQVFYNVNDKNRLLYGSGLLLLPYGNVSVSSSCNCRNLLELAFACYVAVEKKSGPVSEGENVWVHLPFDDYNVGHGE